MPIQSPTIKNRPSVPTRTINTVLKPLPKSLFDAAGLLKKKYPALKKHYQAIRKEWR